MLFMLLIHDIVEVDAGDTLLYSDERKNAHFNEQRAAERIFGILEPDQKKMFIDTWKEYEEGKQTKLNLLWCSIDYSPLPRITYVKVSPGKSIMLLMNKL